MLAQTIKVIPIIETLQSILSVFRTLWVLLFVKGEEVRFRVFGFWVLGLLQPGLRVFEGSCFCEGGEEVWFREGFGAFFLILGFWG